MHVRFNRSTNIKTTLPNTSPRVFAAIKVFKNRLQISFCPTIPKLHLFKQCHLAFLSVWGYPNPQITRWRNLQLLRVDLVDAVSQAARVCPESCMGHAWSTYSIRTYKVHVSRTAQFILFKVEGVGTLNMNKSLCAFQRLLTSLESWATSLVDVFTWNEENISTNQKV